MESKCPKAKLFSTPCDTTHVYWSAADTANKKHSWQVCRNTFKMQVHHRSPQISFFGDVNARGSRELSMNPTCERIGSAAAFWIRSRPPRPWAPGDWIISSKRKRLPVLWEMKELEMCSTPRAAQHPVKVRRCFDVRIREAVDGFLLYPATRQTLIFILLLLQTSQWREGGSSCSLWHFGQVGNRPEGRTV